MNYRFETKQKTLYLGVYPDLSLAAARRLRDQAREKLVHGTDPAAQKQEKKKEVKQEIQNKFSAVAQEWLDKTSVERAARDALAVERNARQAAEQAAGVAALQMQKAEAMQPGRGLGGAAPPIP